jgi:hypothetical protein
MHAGWTRTVTKREVQYLQAFEPCVLTLGMGRFGFVACKREMRYCCKLYKNIKPSLLL